MVNSIIKGNQNTTKLINELKRAAKQYPTLSKKQEEELIATYRNDREKLNDLLFMHNIRLVFNVAKKYMSKTEDFDTMVQNGMLGLAIAANKFDIDRGVKFITYAMPWVRKKILEMFYLRENEITKRSVSLNAPMATGNSKVHDTDDPDLESYVNDYIDPSAMTIKSLRHQLSANEQSSLCADLYNALEEDDGFTEVEKKMFIDMMYNKEKSRDLQRKYKATTKDMAILRDKILAKMRAKLESEYGIHSFSDVYDL